MSRVSYVMMNPGGRAAAHRGRARPRWTTWWASSRSRPPSSGPTCSTWSPSATRSCTTSCSASTRRRSARRRSPWPPTCPSTLGPPTSTWPAPGARLHVLPCIAGHVGADAAAAILAEGPHRGDEVQLLVDVGTNAEIVLGTGTGCSPRRARRVPPSRARRSRAGNERRPAPSSGCASTATRSSPGSRSWAATCGRTKPASRPSLPPRRRHRRSAAPGSSRWWPSCSSPALLDADGTIDGGAAARTDRVVPDGRRYAYVLHHGEADRPPLRITQNDVRAIQLAKAALQAGVRLLMDHAGLTSLADVGSVRLAGAFGSHIDPLYALVLGLLPDCPPERVVSVGNAAGSGAVRALLSGDGRARDRGGGAYRHEDRDRHRTPLPGALRGFAGLPARHRPVPEPGPGGATPAPPTGGQPHLAPTPARPAPTGGHRIMSDTSHRRSGGRAGRQATRLAAHIETRAVPHPHAHPGRGAQRGGRRAHRAQRRHHPRAGRRHLPRLPRGAEHPRRRRGRRRWGPRSLPAWDVPADRHRERPRHLHPARPQPGSQRADRRQRHGARAELRLPLRPRPRPRPPLRHAGRLRELREADLLLAVPAPLGRHGLRAGRRTGQQAAPGHGVRPPPLQRQAVHGLGHRREPRDRTRSTWPASASAATSPAAR